MAGNSGSGKKAEERRARNLASANVSRQRRKEHISSLTEEKARLAEANEMLRARINMQSTSGLPPRYDPGSSSRREGNLGPNMQNMTRKKDMNDKAVIDMLDRAVSGGKGKGPPVDSDAGKKWSDSAKKAPKDVDKPMKYYSHGKGSSSGSKGSSSGHSSSSSKSKGSSSNKKR